MRIANVSAKRPMLLAFALAALVAAAAPAVADDTHIFGFITVRGDTFFTVQTEDGASVIVNFAESTTIKLKDGTKMEAADLTPGLRVEVEGTYDATHRLVAEKVKFGESDLKLARAIKSGLTPATQDVQRNALAIQQQGVAIDRHGETLQEHRRDLSDHEMRIVATSGAIDNTNNRIANLDDFTVVETATVHFANGSAAVDEEHLAELEQLAMRAKGLHGYMVQVQGFASAVGPRPLNEALSMQRADAVVSALEQHGGIVPANVFVPAAMGISEQVAENNTKDGQAQNRRVVVTILQNKGINER